MTDLSVYWASVQTIRILESKVDAALNGAAPAPWFHATGFKRPHLSYRAPTKYEFLFTCAVKTCSLLLPTVVSSVWQRDSLRCADSLDSLCPGTLTCTIWRRSRCLCTRCRRRPPRRSATRTLASTTTMRPSSATSSSTWGVRCSSTATAVSSRAPLVFRW